ncbi:MAG TPA: PH domain-containing protein [Candidatus Binataceae bacterium]|jgi:uncharacterized membrane protein YdbT with pleckstrin-like domain|nr:PH domain-containing protein [Candidatus Binataceae bacterium]
MRCPQCGTESHPQAAFCARCGARLLEPKPAAVREYSIAQVRRSYWYYLGQIILGVILTGVGASLIYEGPQSARVGLAVIVIGIVTWAIIPLAQRTVSWRITSDRLIEQRGLLATTRREVELQDIRSIEVSRRLLQRLIGLGDVVIASAASADYMIRMSDVYDPDGIAETVRKARLKRLA